MSGARVPCAGGIVHDEAGRILLIRRGHAPSAGMWSIPGGKCRDGESAPEACVREMAEETGLRVTVRRHAGRVERAGPRGETFEIDDFVCDVSGGELRARDDALDAGWFARAELIGPAALPVAPGVIDALAEWGLLPD